MLGGCELAGMVAYKVSGPPDVPARYVPRQEPMLVLVENFRNPSASAESADLLARYLFDDLSAHNVAPLVPLEQLRALRDARPAEYPQMSIAAVGKALGAKQILYVRLVHDQVAPLSGGGSGLHGQADVLVKVVDADSGETLWPTDLTDGHAAGARTALDTSAGGTPMDVRQRMYRGLSIDIAKLFHKWKPDDLAPESYAG